MSHNDKFDARTRATSTCDSKSATRIHCFRDDLTTQSLSMSQTPTHIDRPMKLSPRIRNVSEKVSLFLQHQGAKQAREPYARRCACIVWKVWDGNEYRKSLKSSELRAPKRSQVRLRAST